MQSNFVFLSIVPSATVEEIKVKGISSTSVRDEFHSGS
jgi:hypothetical protein